MPADNLYKKNISLLRKSNPVLAQRVERFTSNSNIEILLSKSRQPVPVIDSVTLHSRYDPVNEAHKFVQKIDILKKGPGMVFGLGFGYHIKELLKKRSGRLLVIEPSMDLFKRFLEQIELDDFGGQLEFYIDESPAHVASIIPSKNFIIVEHPPSIRLNEVYFSRLKKGLEGSNCIENNSLRILVIPPIYGGSLPTAKFCFEALESMGHQAFWVDCEKYADGFAHMQECTGNKEHAEILSRKFLEYLSEMIVAKAADARPDIILALAQAPLDIETVTRLKALGAPVVFWFVEDFRTLTYWPEMAPAYDSIFTIQKREFFSKLESIGCSSFHYLPQACQPETHRPLQLNESEKNKYGSPLSFMGAAYYNRVQFFTQLLNYELKIWGTGWDAGSVYGSCLQNDGRRVETQDIVKVYSASSINLNLHSSTFHEGVNPQGDFVNPRTFEIGSCGGFQLVDERSELFGLFDVEKELITFKDSKDLMGKIDHYLKFPKERKNIAAASRARVLKEHTFSHRMKELLIQIYIDHEEKVTRNLNRNQSQWECLLDEAGRDTPLHTFLQKYDGVPELDLQKIRDNIQEGEGDLSDTELLVLMVDQVVKK